MTLLSGNRPDSNRPASTAPAVRRQRIVVLWIGLILPVLLIAVGAFMIWLWLPELPNPAATHWNNGPEPDGFGPPSTYLAVLLAIGGGMAVVMGSVAYGAERRSPGSQTGTWLSAFNLAMAAFMSITMCWSVATQRGLADARQAGSATPSSLTSTGVAALLGIAVWLVLRTTAKGASEQGANGDRAASGVASPNEHSFPLTSGERVMWTGTARMGKGPLIILGLGALLAAGASVYGIVVDRSTLWITGPTLLIVILASASCLTFRVVIGRGGITVRSLIGIPRVHIPPEKVAEVRVVEVDPFAQFGGWGWRFGAGRAMGFVLRKGPGLEVVRHTGSRIVVTIDDATEAAAVLRAVSDSRSAA
jgi:hypothetical protein